MDFGERLKILRKSAKMTQEQLAVKLGVHFQTVSKWERGQIAPDLAMLGSVSTTLSVSLEKLLCIEEKNCVEGIFDCQALGLCIATQRKRFALSQSDLAKKMQTSSDIVSKWERGIVCPRIEQIIVLSQLFSCSPSELYYAKCCNNLIDRFSEEQSKETSKAKRKNWRKLVFIIASVLALIFVVVLVGYVIKINFFEPSKDNSTPQGPTTEGVGNGNETPDDLTPSNPPSGGESGNENPDDLTPSNPPSGGESGNENPDDLTPSNPPSGGESGNENPDDLTPSNPPSGGESGNENPDDLTPSNPPTGGEENENEGNVEKGLLYDINGYECTVRSVGGLKDEESIVIPDTYSGFPVVEIKNDAFKDCVNLKQIIIPQTVNCIGNNAFENCEKLEKIEIPNSVITIGSHVFAGCSSLKKIELPHALTGINENVFENCSSLEDIVLLGNITSIGAGAFRGCSSLKNIYCVNSTEWTSVVTGRNNYYFENALKYYYKSVEPSLLETGVAYDGNYWHYDENDEIVIWEYKLNWYEDAPVLDGVLIKGYSATEPQYNETLKQWEVHKAVDILAGGNGYIYAPCAGKVINVYQSYLDGGVVVFESADGKYTFTYKGVKVDSQIKVGTQTQINGMVLGQVVEGECEMAKELLTGPHVHFEMTYNGKLVDPTLFFTFKTN